MKKLMITMFLSLGLLVGGCLSLPLWETEFYTNLGVDGVFQFSLLGKNGMLDWTTLMNTYQLTLINHGEKQYDVDLSFMLKDEQQTPAITYFSYAVTGERFKYNTSIQEKFSFSDIDFSLYQTWFDGKLQSVAQVTIWDEWQEVDTFLLTETFFDKKNGRFWPEMRTENK